MSPLVSDITYSSNQGRSPRTLPHTLKSLDTLRGYVATTLRCPGCGLPLQAFALAKDTPQHAPWICMEDSHGFFNVELHPAARRLYRAAFRDYGPTSGWIREAVRRERARL